MIGITAQKRTITGKKVASLRAEGLVPAVVYSTAGKTELISIQRDAFLKVWKKAGESTLVSLTIEGGGTHNVLIHDVTVDPVRSSLLHADFYEVSKDRPIVAEVQLTFQGESPAVKALGGSLVKIVHSVEVEALPQNLPHEIIVDISKLGTFEDHILLRDIPLPKGVTIQGDPENLVAKVNPPRSDEELARLSETAEVSIDAIEVQKKGKKEEDTEPSDGE